MSTADLIGCAGVSLLLIAFALNLAKRLRTDSVLYLALNTVGSMLAAVSSYLIGFWPFIILQLVWMLSSAVMLFRNLTNQHTRETSL